MTEQIYLAHLVRVDLGVMAMKGLIYIRQSSRTGASSSDPV